MAWAWHDLDVAQIGNLIEAGLWLAVSAGFLISLRKAGYRGAKLLAGANFAAFGASDLVEAWVNAWPFWLVAWKFACIVIMFAQLLAYTRRRK